MNAVKIHKMNLRDEALTWFDGPNNFEVNLDLVQNILDFVDVCKKVHRVRLCSTEDVIEGCPLIV